MEIHYPVAPDSQTEADSLTVLIHCTVASEHRAAFDAILSRLTTEFRCFAGGIGLDTFEQENGGLCHVTLVQRFATLADHEAWIQSPAFSQWKAEIAPFQTDPVQRYYGLEVLFKSSPEADAPPRWKMFVILTLAAIPISWSLSHWFGQTLASISPLTGALITSPVMVFLMTYIMTPLLSRLFSRWLQPS